MIIIIQLPITKNQEWRNFENASFGKDWIDSMSDDIYIFYIKVHYLKDGDHIGVGFVANYHKQDTERELITLQRIPFDSVLMQNY